MILTEIFTKGLNEMIRKSIEKVRIFKFKGKLRIENDFKI